MAVRTGLPTWMAYKPQTLAQPTYDVVARNYSHYRIPRPPAPEEGGSPPGQICWGTVGEMPTAEAAPTVDFQVVGEEWKEWGRKSNPVRVENPDDPSQYVMEDRPSQVKFNTAASNAGQPGPNTSSQTPGGVTAFAAGDQRGFVPQSSAASVTPKMITMNYKQ